MTVSVPLGHWILRSRLPYLETMTPISSVWQGCKTTAAHLNVQTLSDQCSEFGFIQSHNIRPGQLHQYFACLSVDDRKDILVAEAPDWIYQDSWDSTTDFFADTFIQLGHCMVDAEVPVAGSFVEATLTFEERTLDIELGMLVQLSEMQIARTELGYRFASLGNGTPH